MLPLQSALARQQQLLREALQELGGVQYCCAELAKGLPEHHSAYQALVAAMDSAPSLSTFSTQAGNEGAEEQGANGCLGGAETETGRQQGSRGCAPNGQGPLGKKKEDDGRHQRRRLQDIKNPFLRAMIAEGGNHVGEKDLAHQLVSVQGRIHIVPVAWVSCSAYHPTPRCLGLPCSWNWQQGDILVLAEFKKG